MKLLVISTAPVLSTKEGLVAYSPLVKELDLWFKYAEHITILAPTKYSQPLLTKAFKRQDINLKSIPGLHFNTFLNSVKSTLGMVVTIVKLLAAMSQAEHIHIRCPGNSSLLACFVQILFPKKQKTAKYAGNWDPKSKQPRSYRLQKSILSNTLFTKNMQALVYGDWEGRSKNIKPFFTASYYENQIEPAIKKDFSEPFRFLFIGTLSPGKQPIRAIELVQQLRAEYPEATLAIYGEGAERKAIEEYIDQNKLASMVTMHGNRPSDEILKAYKSAHFLILNSLSEGWPKVVAEAMFWGVVPIASAVSCVPWMLDNESRGILIKEHKNVAHVLTFLKDTTILESCSEQGMLWSRQYTLDRFESEINKLLRP